MQVNITGRNIEITPAIRDFVNKKIMKVIEDLKRPVECNMILEIEKRKHIAEIIISGDTERFYIKKSASDLYSAIEGAVHAADLKIKKFKEKQKTHKMKMKTITRKTGRKGGVEIIDYNISNVKPMSIDEAFLELNALKKHFIIFKDSRKFRPNILYKEKNNIYLVTPGSPFLGFLFKSRRNIYLRYLLVSKGDRVKIKAKEQFQPMDFTLTEALNFFTRKKYDHFFFKDKTTHSLVFIYKMPKGRIGRFDFSTVR